MKKSIVFVSFLVLLFSVSASAQDKEEQLPLGQLLEKDAAHNLDVAWQYFKQRKAYVAVLIRTEETIAAHPGYSKMDEILYLSGMSSYYLSIGKGKQKIDLDKMSESDREKFAPERLREDAFAYLGQLIDDFPESKYARKAKPTYKKLKPADN